MNSNNSLIQNIFKIYAQIVAWEQAIVLDFIEFQLTRQLKLINRISDQY